MANIGKNILDNLTTGMYSDSKIIFREYIQNAADQIDKAIALGLIKRSNALIDIELNTSKRFISIEDNATGVPRNEFISTLGDIANSDKTIGKDKGFRGIGRLCGLAYCKKLKFVTSYSGESIASVMEIDALQMRKMLLDKKKYSVDEVWDAIVDYSSFEENSAKHYFRVELYDINEENKELLDKSLVEQYLSFVAPLPYKNTFYFRSKIYEFSEKINYTIDEYVVKINGNQIFKEYTYALHDKNGSFKTEYDKITDLAFKEFKNEKEELVAWMWYGLSSFIKQIPPCNIMRGIRLRTQNIQIGNDNTLTSFFKEQRGNYYFVGEVFTIDKNLIPNSQRDYFNENSSRVMFENAIKTFFYEKLHSLYYNANQYKNAYKKQTSYVEAVDEYNTKVKNGDFIDEEARVKAQIHLEEAKEEADKAKKTIDKFEGSLDEEAPLKTVIENIQDALNTNSVKKKISNIKVIDKSDKKEKYLTQKLSKLNRSERKLVSKILSIVSDNIEDKDVAKKKLLIK